MKMLAPNLLIADALVTPDKFAAWLAGKEDTEQVGAMCQTRRCPIANFLLSLNIVNDDQWIYVGPTCVVVNNGGSFGRDVSLTELPEWAVKFILNVDHKSSQFQITCNFAKQTLSGVM